MCAAHESGSEAGTHAVHYLFEADDTDAVLLIDATNPFNFVNRATALHHIRILCPALATNAINTYRVPVRLFVTGGKELPSTERNHARQSSSNELLRHKFTTHLSGCSNVKQCLFTDNATGVGE